MAQEIIVNASTTAAKEVIFATFEASGTAAAITSLSLGDILWRVPDGALVTAVGVVSLVGSNIYRYLPHQIEVSVPGRAILTVAKTSVQRVYEMIDIRGPAMDTAPMEWEVVVSTTGSRVPFRVYEAYTRMPAAGLSFSAGEVFISHDCSAYATAGGSVTTIGNGDYAYIVSTADVSSTFTNLLQIRKAGYYSPGAIFGVYASLAATGNRLQVDVASIASGAITSAVFSSAAAEKVADSLLGRNIKGGSSTGRTVTQALAFLRNRVSRTETAYSVYDVDDTSVVWGGSVMTSLSATPITELRPSS